MVVAAGGGAGGNSYHIQGGGGGGAGGFRESPGTASGCYTVSPLGAAPAVALPVSVQQLFNCSRRRWNCWRRSPLTKFPLFS